MGSGISTAWGNKLLGLLFGGVALSAPAALYVGLCTSVNAAGTVSGEPAAGNYSRVEVTNGDTKWNAAAAGSVSNKVAFEFPESSAPWGTMKMFFLANHSSNSGEAVIAYGDLNEDQVIGTNNKPSFAAGALQIQLTGTA